MAGMTRKVQTSGMLSGEEEVVPFQTAKVIS